MATPHISAEKGDFAKTVLMTAKSQKMNTSGCSDQC